MFDEVQENSMEIWKFERYRLIREYDTKPGLVAPFLVLEHVLRLAKYCWKLIVRTKKENCESAATVVYKYQGKNIRWIIEHV